MQAIKALLIEDNSVDAALIQELIRGPGCGISLEIAASLSDGLERVNQGGLDIVIVDLNLPDSSGIDTVAKTLAKTDSIPVVVLTGFSGEYLGVNAISLGTQDYLVKGEIDGKILERSLRYAIERKKAITSLKASENKLQTITSVLGEGLLVLDERGRLTFMNPEAEKLLGWRQDELVGRGVHDVIHHHNRVGVEIDSTECPIFKTTHSGLGSRVAEDAFIRKDGTFFPVSYVATPLKEDNVVIGSVTAFHDISERKQLIEALERANELLSRQAETDTLTGIYNRLKFNELLEAEVRRAERYGMPLSLIMFDIDYFKRINDQHGHQTGDHVLKEMAKIVSKNLRQSDGFARWGGEEFMVLAPGSDIGQGAVLAEKLRAVIERHDFGNNLNVTASFGVAGFSHDDSLEIFTNKADEAMYRAKKNGRNRVEGL